MRWAGVLLILAACDAPAPALDPGGFRLSISQDLFWTEIDARYQIEPGGALTGHNSSGYFACDELLTDEEQVELAHLLDRANVLVRGDSPDSGCVDQSVWTFEIMGTSGDAAGMHNRFVYDVCGVGDEDPDVGAVINSLWERITMSTAAGRCDTCTPELEAASCHGDLYGVASFCFGAERADCSAADAGTVIACADGLECDGERWIPATTWSLLSSTVYRWDDGESTTYWLDLTLDVDNVSDSYLVLSDVPDHMEAFNAAGGSVPFAPSDFGVGTVGSHTRATVTQRYRAFQSSASIATLVLRERPWDGVPFAAPVAVAQIDGPPPGF